MTDKIMLYVIQVVQPGDKLSEHKSKVNPGSRAGDQDMYSMAGTEGPRLGSHQGWGSSR